MGAGLAAPLLVEGLAGLGAGPDWGIVGSLAQAWPLEGSGGNLTGGRGKK